MDPVLRLHLGLLVSVLVLVSPFLSNAAMAVLERLNILRRGRLCLLMVLDSADAAAASAGAADGVGAVSLGNEELFFLRVKLSSDKLKLSREQRRLWREARMLSMDRRRRSKLDVDPNLFKLSRELLRDRNDSLDPCNELFKLSLLARRRLLAATSAGNDATTRSDISSVIISWK